MADALRLRPTSVPATESAALRPAVVEYDGGDAAGDMAYADTNQLLDSLAAAPVDGKPLADLLRYEGHRCGSSSPRTFGLTSSAPSS